MWINRRLFAVDCIVQGVNEFFCVDMHLTHDGFFIVFQQAHGVADVVVVKV